MKAPSKTLIARLFAVALFSEPLFPAFSSSFGSGATSIGKAAPQQQAPATSPEGAELYRQKCAVCHDNPQDRIPPLFLIRRRSAEDVVMTLTSGSMKLQAAGLTAGQIR